MNADQLRLSIALAHAVPGAALRIAARDGGAFFACDHPAGELRVDDLRVTLLAERLDAHVRLDSLITEAEVGGTLMALGAGIYLSGVEEGTPTLWAVVSLSPVEVACALEAIECPPAPACIEVALRPDVDLGATVIKVSSLIDVGEEPLLDVALHVLGACLALELEGALGHRSSR